MSLLSRAKPKRLESFVKDTRLGQVFSKALDKGKMAGCRPTLSIQWLFSTCGPLKCAARTCGHQCLFPLLPNNLEWKLFFFFFLVSRCSVCGTCSRNAAKIPAVWVNFQASSYSFVLFFLISALTFSLKLPLKQSYCEHAHLSSMFACFG